MSSGKAECADATKVSGKVDAGAVVEAVDEQTIVDVVLTAFSYVTKRQVLTLKSRHI